MDQGAIIPMLDSVAGFFIWAAAGAIWCHRLWQRSHPPPSVDNSAEAPPVADGEGAIHPAAPPKKDRKVASILAILLGGVGVQHFYLGNRQRGLIYVLLGLLQVSPHLGLIDGITYLTKPDDVFQRNYMNWFCGYRLRRRSHMPPPEAPSAEVPASYTATQDTGLFGGYRCDCGGRLHIGSKGDQGRARCNRCGAVYRSAGDAPGRSWVRVTVEECLADDPGIAWAMEHRRPACYPRGGRERDDRVEAERPELE